MMDYLRLKFRLIEAATSPILFLAFTLYRPASVSITSSSSRTTRNLFVPTLCIRKLVLESAASSISPRYHDISGFGELISWHSKISRFPSSSCLSCGFWVKLGAKSSATPMSSGRPSANFSGGEPPSFLPSRASSASPPPKGTTTLLHARLKRRRPAAPSNRPRLPPSRANQLLSFPG